MDIPQITAEDVKRSIDAKENIVLLDVRTKEEFGKGKIEGSINLPLDEIEEKITSVIPDKNQKIYAYCLSGSRSTLAVNIMVKMGYTNIYSLTSGLLAWRVKNYPIAV